MEKAGAFTDPGTKAEAEAKQAATQRAVLTIVFELLIFYVNNNVRKYASHLNQESLHASLMGILYVHISSLTRHLNFFVVFLT